MRNLTNVYTKRMERSVDPMKSDIKKVVGYRLNSAAVQKLELLSRQLRRSKTDIMEQLIVEYLPEMAQAEARRIAEELGKYQVKSKPPASS